VGVQEDRWDEDGTVCNDLCLSCLRICGRYPYNETAAPEISVLHTIGKFPRIIPIRDMHIYFETPSEYGNITKLCRQQAHAIQNHENSGIPNIGQGEARHRKYKRLKLLGGQAYD
jgi:hypothetical protein